MASEKAPELRNKAAPKIQDASRIDLATLAGLVLGLGGIVGGLILEGGNIREILAPTALMIVLGGTFGAVLVTTPLAEVKAGIRALKKVFVEKSENPESLIATVVDYATKARKGGIVTLEGEADTAPDPFFRKALNLAVDGADLQELKKMMELEMEIEERASESEAKLFEGAGGYAPTIGIIGAVLGLIQVMKDLADISKVGHGIATAFVATIYGVGFANLLFLPAAGKIKARAQQKTLMRELILEGVIGIVEGLNPKLIRTKLEPYARADEPKPGARKPAPAEQPSDRPSKAVEA